MRKIAGIEYDERGQGPAVLMIHGAIISDSFEPMMEEPALANYRLIRYDHVLLWLAECEVELGNLEKAREYVNLIRKRAGNPDGLVAITRHR